jgi:gamma-glutamylcyclotransferase (GGCT)/AIG2-like uncharacterized protein YtfP
MLICTDNKIDRDKTYLVGVYGTLKKGYSNNYMIGEAKYIGDGKINAVLIKYEGFPGCVFYRNIEPNHPSKAFCCDMWTCVEVYQVTGNMLAAMDRLESHPNWYKRELIHVSQGSFTGEAWVYGLKPSALIDQKKIVKDGRWLGNTENGSKLMLVDFGRFGDIKPKIIQHEVNSSFPVPVTRWDQHIHNVSGDEELAYAVLDMTPSQEEEDPDPTPEAYEMEDAWEIRSA